ncbi:hypothetical protein S3_058 [Pseudomonas phage vB_PaeS_SCUT-S3]|uniref:Uncharacterized protein n=1 Tax=Pseudomonas phage vB_PaeS_SCUT-S3 TaxID=2382122 RepID=A0A3Q8L4J6_9CAUD|nr:hypothetical protein P7H99_gp58 [Pseudomonas phage vB_PaeS_SCUT-S3]AZF90063.1 hypothetical protein S3_058 [Pseudomonas phage vB_PaeS_SCUT-S3]
MNIDPLFMTIGLAALAAAVWLKLREMKNKREQDRRIREAIERAQVVKARGEIRGKKLANEREWGLAEDYNPGKFWPQ